jgi:hypothetical protein
VGVEAGGAPPLVAPVRPGGAPPLAAPVEVGGDLLRCMRASMH